jgi:O-antigen ligase
LPLAFALVGGVALVVAALLQPAVSLPLLVLSLPFGLVREISLGGARLGIPEGLLFVALAGWIAQGAARRKLAVRTGPLLWPLAVFAWVTALSLVDATSVQETLAEVVKWTEAAALYLMARSVAGPRGARWIIAAALIAGTAQGLLGVYQFVRQAGPESFRQGRFLRAFGTFAQPNPYAGYLGMVAPLGLSLSWWALGRIWREPRRARSWARFAVYALPTAACAAGIAMSGSRGGWLGFAAAILTILVAQSGRSRLALLILMIALAATGLLGSLGLLPPTISARLADFGAFVGPLDLQNAEVTDANFSVLERIAHWYAGLEMFADHPWLGVGAGNYALAYPAYALARWQDPLGHAHNIYINVAAETGWIGLIAFAAVWIAAIIVALRAVQTRSGYRRAVAIGVLGVLMHVTVHNLFDNLFVQRMYLQIALLLVLL